MKYIIFISKRYKTMADIVYEISMKYVIDDLRKDLVALDESTITAFLNYWIRPVSFSHPIRKYLVHTEDYEDDCEDCEEGGDCEDDEKKDEETLEFEYKCTMQAGVFEFEYICTHYDQLKDMYDEFQKFAGQKLFSLVHGHPELIEAMIKLYVGTDEMVPVLFKECATSRHYMNLKELIDRMSLNVDETTKALIDDCVNE